MSKEYMVVFSGSCIDTYYDVETILGPADAGHAALVGDVIGGCMLNTGVITSSLGSDVKVIDYMRSNDTGTNLLLDGMKKVGIDTSYIQFSEEVVNGQCLIMRCGSEKCIYVIRPKRPLLERTKEMQELLNGAKYIYSMQDHLRIAFGSDLSPIHEARAHGAKVVFDGTNQYQDPLMSEMLYDLADGLFINTQSYEKLSAVSNGKPEEILLAKGAEFVCVTDGEKGAVCYYQGGSCRSDAMTIDVVDSTGAGDSYAGCFLHCRLEGMSYEKAIRYACANGAYACVGIGGQSGATTEEALEAFAKEHGFAL